MCSFHLESPMWLVKMLTCDFRNDTSSVDEAHNHFSVNYFWPSRKLKTTYNKNSWKCGQLKQIIIISNVFNNEKM